MNRGTKASGKGTTRIGSDTLIMSYAHIAHDCQIGNHCIIVSYAGLAGETDVDDWGVMGGKSGSHQFTKVGAHAFVAGFAKLTKDVPPYVLAGREPLVFEGVNRVGLLRRGFTEEQVNEIKDIYDTLYFKGMNVSQLPGHRNPGHHPALYPGVQAGYYPQTPSHPLSAAFHRIFSAAKLVCPGGPRYDPVSRQGFAVRSTAGSL